MAFFTAGLAILWSLYGLVPIMVGTLIGDGLYREAAAWPSLSWRD